MTKRTILKIEQFGEQECGPVRKIVGLLAPKSFCHLVDVIDLSANPRSAKKGAVTTDIETSLIENPELFPAKTKGILLASSFYKELERKRFEFTFVDPETEGLLDGGHNALAIGRFILQQLGISESRLRKVKDWESFAQAWDENRQSISKVEDILDFLVPVEIQVPRLMTDQSLIDEFKSSLLEIGSARNNNVQLTEETKANKQGLYETLKNSLPSAISENVEWKSNDGGFIKVRDLIALTWVPLSLLSLPGQIRVNPNQIYRNKAVCVENFNKLLKHDEVSTTVEGGYDYQIVNESIESAIKIGAQMPMLYDALFEKFPDAYNKSGGSFGKISAVKLYQSGKEKENPNKYVKSPIKTPYLRKNVASTCPDGFLIPFIYGMRSLMSVDSQGIVSWAHDPQKFIDRSLVSALKSYRLAIELGNWDPQQVGKKISAYDFAESAIKNSLT